MTLDEIFKDDEAYPVPEKWPKIVVEITEAELRRAGHQLDESRWTPSCVRGLYQRIDPARPEMRQRRHVHIADKKHLGSAHQQASWNDDGSRHDRHSFNAKFGSRASVRDVARVALGLPDDMILEHLTKVASLLETILEIPELLEFSQMPEPPTKITLVTPATRTA